MLFQNNSALTEVSGVGCLAAVPAEYRVLADPRFLSSGWKVWESLHYLVDAPVPGSRFSGAQPQV